jgi:hypothetical protein
MPGRPYPREAGAPTDPGSAPVGGHGDQFRRGVDQLDYVRLLRCFASFDRAALHPSVTQRATLYGFHPQRVSSQPSETKAVEPIPAQLGSFRGRDRPWGSRLRRLHHECRGDGAEVSPGHCADRRVEPVFRSLHAWTLKSRPQASQPMADCAQSENVSGCPVAPSIHGTPPPAARKTPPLARRRSFCGVWQGFD